MLLKNGNALIFSRNGFVPQDIRIEGGKVTAMADTLAPLPGEEVVDASDCHITPGLIDAHSHICISEEGGGSEGDDCCDYSGTSTPELEVLDGLYPFDRAVKDCVRAGVTSCCVCPGSDGVVGGVASTIRLTGCVPDEMIVRRMTAMKCSVGENPKKANYSFCSRMGVAYQLRKSFDDALEYKYCKEEATKAGTHFHKDRGMEHMLLVLNKEMPVHMHAHRSDDICTAIRLAQEFDFDLVIIHGTDAIPIVGSSGQVRLPRDRRPLLQLPLQARDAGQDLRHRRSAQPRRSQGLHLLRPRRDPHVFPDHLCGTGRALRYGWPGGPEGRHRKSRPGAGGTRIARAS